MSVLLDGEYGQKDVFCSVPVILNRDGASKILEIDMLDKEDGEFKNSIETIRQYIQTGGFQHEIN